MKRNRALISPWNKHVPLPRFRIREKPRSTTCSRNKKGGELKIGKPIENTNINDSAHPTGQRRHVRISHRNSRTQHTSHSWHGNTPAQTPVYSQQATHSNSSDVLGPLFPGLRAKAKIIRGQLSTMPSGTRLQVRSQQNLKFDPGASTLGVPGSPREAQLPPGSKGRRVCMLLWWIFDRRALDCRHVYVALDGP